MKIWLTFFGNTFDIFLLTFFRGRVAGNYSAPKAPTFCWGGANRTILAFGGGPKCPSPLDPPVRSRPGSVHKGHQMQRDTSFLSHSWGPKIRWKHSYLDLSPGKDQCQAKLCNISIFTCLSCSTVSQDLKNTFIFMYDNEKSQELF